MNKHQERKVFQIIFHFLPFGFSFLAVDVPFPKGIGTSTAKNEKPEARNLVQKLVKF